MVKKPLIFSGSSNLALAQEVAFLLQTHLGEVKIQRFPDQEISVEVLEEVQGKEVYVLQSLSPQPNEQLMELFILIDALKRKKVASIHLIAPYYSYARQDKFDEVESPLTAKLIADLLSFLGVCSLITLDLHFNKIENFFSLPFQHLLSRTLLIPYCASLNLTNVVVVSPDKGGITIAKDYANQLNYELAVIEKKRIDSFQVNMRMIEGKVANQTVLLTDDICSTAGTLTEAAALCVRLGAKRIIAVIAHGLLTSQAIQLIEQSFIEKLIMTNSVAISPELYQHPKIHIISIAPLIAEAIQRQAAIVSKEIY